MQIDMNQRPLQVGQWIEDKWDNTLKKSLPIHSPQNGIELGHVIIAQKEQIDLAILMAQKAFESWSDRPLRERTQVLFNFRQILSDSVTQLAPIISLESGKTISEATAGLMKGLEVVEYALSIQNFNDSSYQQVSRGVSCHYLRKPVGVVCGITPFNFPAMVPLWMMPLALVLGNAFIWKPSDKTPLTSYYLAQIWKESGLPKSVLNVLQGDKEVVRQIITHPLIKNVAFVGSTPVAQSIYQMAASHSKKVLALGGAKNHIILLPDADADLASQAIVDAFTGCAGQRCMAASVLVAVGNCNSIIQKIVQKAQKIQVGQSMGAIITQQSKDFIIQSIDKAKQSGAQVLLDGRQVNIPEELIQGNWLAPTILDHVDPTNDIAHTEVFGPVLSIIRTSSLEEAIKIENSNLYGNACSVFTNSGGCADFVAQNANAGMIGINIGVPVPREPFSFGGLYQSKFGVGDITGEDGVNFWTIKKKITTKWAFQPDQTWMS